jgi:ERCC4-related helicase
MTLLLIKELAENHRTVLLVPRFSLAKQQAATLRVYFPHVPVGIAKHAAVLSENRRSELSQSQILVATPGAYLNLLTHHSDQFSLDSADLLILDECHASLESKRLQLQYSKILQNVTLSSKYPQNVTLSKQPRILGMTVSPLAADVKKIRKLEKLLRLRIASLAEPGLCKKKPIKRAHANDLLQKAARLRARVRVMTRKRRLSSDTMLPLTEKLRWKLQRRS